MHIRCFLFPFALTTLPSKVDDNFQILQTLTYSNKYQNPDSSKKTKKTKFMAKTYQNLYSTDTSDRRQSGVRSMSVSNTYTCDYNQLCHFLK